MTGPEKILSQKPNLRKIVKVSLTIFGLALLTVFIGLIIFELTEGRNIPTKVEISPNSNVYQVPTSSESAVSNRSFKLRPPLDIKVNKIAFIRDNQVWLVNPDGSGQEQITKEKRFWEIVSWSLDGSKLALNGVVDKFVGVERLPDGCDSYYSCAGRDLFYYNLAEKKVKRLTTVPEGGSFETLSWAPDSNRYIYVLENNEIVIGDIKTGKQNVVTLNFGGLGSYSISHEWAPNGEKILFDTNNDVNNSRTYLIFNSNGEHLESLNTTSISLPSLLIQNIHWGKDDTQLVLTASKWYPPPGGNYESDSKIFNVLLLNNKVKSLRQIVQQKGVNLGFSSVIVSPNRNYIGVLGTLNGEDFGSNQQISIFDINGKLIQEGITKEVGPNLRGFSWSPKEDMLAVSNTLGEVFSLSIKGKATKILDKAEDPHWSPI